MKPKKPTMRQVAEHLYKTDILLATLIQEIEVIKDKLKIKDE